MPKKRYIIEKSKELPRSQKYHGLRHDSEYKTIGTDTGIGVPMAVVPMEDDEVDHVRELPQVIKVYEDRDISYPTPPSSPSAPSTRSDVQVEGIQALQLHRSPELWDIGIKGQGINAWVLDTGIDQTHAENLMKGNLKGISTVSDIGGSGWDRDGHGTWCCGMVAEPNGEYGAAPQVDLYSCKVLDDSGSGSWSGIIEGIDRATQNGAHVISMSLGGDGPADSPVVRAVDAASDKGVIVVVAAGNDGCSGNPADSSVPARATSAITVAAHDLNKVMASFSSCGVCVDVAAMGVGATSLGLNGTKGARMSGTSMATPHVAGIVCLLRSAGFGAIEVRKALRDGTVDLGYQQIQQGAGMVDAVRSHNVLSRDGDGLLRMSYSKLNDTPKNDLPSKLMLTYYRVDHAVLSRV